MRVWAPSGVLDWKRSGMDQEPSASACPPVPISVVVELRMMTFGRGAPGRVWVQPVPDSVNRAVGPPVAGVNVGTGRSAAPAAGALTTPPAVRTRPRRAPLTKRRTVVRDMKDSGLGSVTG